VPQWLRNRRAGSWVRSGIAVAVAAVLVLPGPLAARADPADPEGGSATLQAQLEAASRGYNDAKGRLDAAKARQAELEGQAQATEAQLATVNTQVRAAAVTAYKGGRLSGLSILLDAGSAADFLDRATRLQIQLQRDTDALRRLHALQAQHDVQRTAIGTEITQQQAQLVVMDKRRKDAQAALTAAGGGAATSGPSGGTASAAPSPRNPDGTWPKESCSADDPTTSGCLTPRTLHALQEARNAGFTHYTACFRSGSSGEHPLGRACDFSANASTFVDAAATGADKAYGDRLAAWFLANTDRLAVLYVIWYGRIWMPSTGWRTYHGDGTAAGDHMNHVHLSVQ
jgi:peptidoglycan DL-endopeptidase CwlO